MSTRVRSGRASRPLLAAITVAIAGGAGTAAAQVTPYHLKGSDTLFEVTTDSINNAVSKGVFAANTLVYDGSGSGNAENEMKNVVGGGINLGIQSIGPMSRNFRPATTTQFPTWAPTVQNVLGLDAAIVVRRNGSSCTNLTVPITPGTGSNSDTATPNDAAAPINFGTVGSGYTQIIEIVLSGKDGSGSVEACSDQRRVQAVADLAACLGLGNLNHFYRRDDNSGTTDTFKDRTAVQRFCNGAAVGQNTARTDGNYNLNNQDFDPIRRPCAVSSATRTQSTCTDLSTGLLCNTTAASCTQGLVVALSVGDPPFTDVTPSIGKRVADDTTGGTLGFAGREASRTTGVNAAAVFVNRNPPSDTLVRADTYLLSRRLFLQRGPSNPGLDGSATNVGGVTTPPPAAGGNGNQRINDLAGPSTLTCGTGACTGLGAAQLTAEDKLFNYMTDPNGSASPDNAPGRCNTDPVLTAHGFIPCLSDLQGGCLATPSGTSNLCSKAPYPTVPATASACIPSGAAALWNYGSVSCSSGSVCCSTGQACPASGTCPAANGRAVNSACSVNGVQAECANGLTCTDIGAGLLTCQ